MQTSATTPVSTADRTSAAHLPMPGTRTAGVAIAAATILSIIFVALDDGATGTTPTEIMQSMLQIKTMKQIVHGVAITSVLAYAFGYATLANKLNLKRPLVLAGLTTYLIGCVAMIGATMLDGFISNDVAARFVIKPPADLQFGFNMIRFMGIALTDLAKLGWVLQAGAAMAWSAVLIEQRGLHRAVGFIGLLSGALVMAGVFTSDINMGMVAILGILLAQAIWNLAAATLLIRNKEARSAA